MTRRTLLSMAAAATLPNAASGSVTRVTSSSEPGVPLRIEGMLVGDDGRTPLPGAKLRIYHTDSGGYYNRQDNDTRKARITATIPVQPDGSFAFESIRPGRYPESRIAAHIHVFLSAPGVAEHWIDDFLFDDDTFNSGEVLQRSRAAGRFAFVMNVERTSSGLLRARREIKLDRAVAQRNRLVNGWYAR